VKTETLVARLLFLGGVASVALMLAGLVDLEVHAAARGHAVELPRVAENREAGRSVDVFVSMPALVRGLRQRPPDPVAIATAGVVVLLLTPVAGLLAALVGFARERDSAYVVIATLLIAALLFGFALRLGG
jgi:uncharacterized membrane protein